MRGIHAIVLILSGSLGASMARGEQESPSPPSPEVPARSQRKEEPACTGQVIPSLVRDMESRIRRNSNDIKVLSEEIEATSKASKQNTGTIGRIQASLAAMSGALQEAGTKQGMARQIGAAEDRAVERAQALLERRAGRLSTELTREREAARQLTIEVGRLEAALRGTRSDLARTSRWVTVAVVAVALVCLGGLAYLATRVSRIGRKHRKLVVQLVELIRGRQALSPDPVEQDVVRAEPGSGSAQGTEAPLLPGSEPIPQVLLARQVLEVLVDGINRHRRVRPGAETGFALVGKVLGEGPHRRLLVNGLIQAGTEAAFSPGSVKFDRAFQQRELEMMQLLDQRACHIGDAHLHPGSLDTCSAGDLETDLGNVRASMTQEMVFVIATASGWRIRSEESLHVDGLKLDFFYLGKSSGYEYRRFVPEVIDEPVSQVNPALRAFAEAAPVRTRLDFASLRRLPGQDLRVTDMRLDGAELPCVELTHRAMGYKAAIVFGPDPLARPHVFVDTGAELVRYEPEFLNGGWSPLIWFTQIALEIEKEMACNTEVTPDENEGTAREGEPTSGEPKGGTETEDLRCPVAPSRRAAPARDGREEE